MYIPKYSPLWRDYYLGLRCKYLILYGVLPASLISLGVLQVESIALPKLGVSLIALLIIACVPIYVTYSFIKFKVDQYYVIKGDIVKRCCLIKGGNTKRWNNKEYIRGYSNIRALIMTSIILLTATVVSMANGVILGQYTHTSILQSFIESLLTAAISLVVSSALFMTVLRENVDFPGLPSKAYVDRVSSIKQCMCGVTKNNRLFWKAEWIETDIQDLIKDIDNCITKIRDLQKSFFCREDEKEFIDELIEDINNLRISAEETKMSLDGESWKKYFPESYDDRPLRDEEKKRRASINNIRTTGWC